MINLIIVGEMKLYLIAYDGGLLPPCEFADIWRLTAAVKFDNL